MSSNTDLGKTISDAQLVSLFVETYVQINHIQPDVDLIIEKLCLWTPRRHLCAMYSCINLGKGLIQACPLDSVVDPRRSGGPFGMFNTGRRPSLPS
jgi:hypothetical protein